MRAKARKVAKEFPSVATSTDGARSERQRASAAKAATVAGPPTLAFEARRAWGNVQNLLKIFDAHRTTEM